LDQFITQPSLYLPLAYLKSPNVDTTLINNLLNGYALDIRMIKASVSGITCEGITRFDSDTLSWDDGATRFVEVSPSVETTFDEETTVWESATTSFDLITNPQIRLSRTIIDGGQTLFDYYATLFDEAPYSTDSSYTRTWIWWFGKPWDSAK
jgi:hypothetical protein